MSPIELQEQGSYLLPLLVLSPFFGIALLALVPQGRDSLARSVSLVSSLLSFVISLMLLQQYSSSVSAFQFGFSLPWISSFGASFTFGIDGISLWLIVLTTFLTTLVLFASPSIHEKKRSYLSCLLLLEVGMLGTFVSLDGLSFYLFWELMLVPMYFLIGIWGGSRKIYAALKFVLYTAFGSLLMLVAMVYLAWTHHEQFGTYSFYLGDWMRLALSDGQEMTLYAAFALAFAIKIPLFPLHTWLPDAHVEAPTGGSVILAGVLLKMGIYGLIRFGVPIFPNAVHETAWLLGLLGVIGIVYGALVAWVQTDIKKLVAYSSVSHLGFCVLGFAAMNIQGLQGSVLQMINHGISTAALFFIVGVLYDRKHTREITSYGGVVQVMPKFACVYLIFTLSSIGLPLTNGFVGEFLILLGAFKFSWVLTVFAVSGVVLGAMYMLSLYRRVMFGEIDMEKNGDLEDLNLREGMIFAPLLVLVFLIGLFPQTILDDLEPASQKTIKYVAPAKASAAAALTELEKTSDSREIISLESSKAHQGKNS
jgi:NADH-quinone oxidoreductase subunit M